MKIDITYQKADLLSLVVNDLRRKGIKVKEGTIPAVKAPLEIKLAIETEDDEVTAAPTPVAAEPKTVSPEQPVVSVAAEPEVDISNILGASKALVMTHPGKFEQRPARQLGPNESYEYPKE